jgi:hypothetical protein
VYLACLLHPTSSATTTLSQLEASFIKQAVVEAKSDQVRLAHEIAHFQTLIDTLHNKKETIGEYIGTHEALLAPARRITPKILSEIFLWCFVGGTLGTASGFRRDVPIVIGQVCTYWTVAISTPRLWSSLYKICSGGGKYCTSNIRRLSARYFFFPCGKMGQPCQFMLGHNFGSFAPMEIYDFLIPSLAWVTKVLPCQGCTTFARMSDHGGGRVRSLSNQ